MLLATAMVANATDYTGSLFKTVGSETTETKDVKLSLTSDKVNIEVPGQDALSFFSVSSKTAGHVTFYQAYNNYGFLKAEVRSDAKNADSPITVLYTQFKEDGSMEIYRFGNQRYTIGQLLGSNFENFHTAKNGNNTSDEPDGWHSFMSSVTSGLTGMVKNKVFTTISDDVRPGSTGKHSVKLVSHSMLGLPANGTLTTGQLYAKSTDKSDASKNNSTSDPDNSTTDGAGDPFYAPFALRPDSIAVWVKFKQGNNVSNPEAKYATLNAVFTDGTKYQDPEDKEYTNVYGKATYNTIESNDFQWQRICVPFKYTDSSNKAGALLVTLSTNAEAGVGAKDDSNPDQLYIDDMEMIYDTHLKTLKFDGAEIEGFSPDKTEYEIKYKGNLDGSRFVTTPRSNVMGMAADFVEKGDYTDYVLTVVGADLVSTTTYTVHMVKDEPKVEYNDNLAININGEDSDSQQTTIITTQHDDGTYDFMIKNFTFGGEDGFLIGDVTAKNITATTENGYTFYKAEQDAVITNGAEIAEALGGKVHIKLDAQSKDGKLYAEISLPVDMGDGDVLNVFAVFGDKSWTGINSVKANPGTTRIYNANGMLMQQMQRGLNIVKGSDGKTVKVLKK